jgi:hypothetical protein
MNERNAVSKRLSTEREATAMTWREILGLLLKKKEIKQQLEEITSERTLFRWISGSTESPQIHLLRQVASVIPDAYRGRFIQSVNEEIPQARLEDNREGRPPFIPVEFILRILVGNQQVADSLRWQTLAMLEAEQLEDLLDANGERDMALLLARCLRSAGGMVHALQWKILLSGGLIFPYGDGAARIECSGLLRFVSQAMCSMDLLIVDDLSQAEVMLPDPYGTIQSLAAIAIIRGGKVAGCMLFLSPQAHFFCPSRVEVIQKYSVLFPIGFSDDDFSTPECIQIPTLSVGETPFQQDWMEILTRKTRAYLLQGMDTARAGRLAYEELARLLRLSD